MGLPNSEGYGVITQETHTKMPNCLARDPDTQDKKELVTLRSCTREQGNRPHTAGRCPSCPCKLTLRESNQILCSLSKGIFRWAKSINEENVPSVQCEL